MAVFVARDDPLDTFVVHHPESVFGQPVEAAVLDPDNPYVLAPHLCAAAAEIPLTDTDFALFGPSTADVVPDLVRRGLLRHRAAGWYWTKRERATDLADLRGTGGSPVRIVELGTGRLLGTVDAAAAHSTVHAGAVYLHQGESHVVDTFEVDDGVALVVRGDQLHRERLLCRLRGDRLLGRRLCLADLPAPPARRPAGRGCARVRAGEVFAITHDVIIRESG